MLAFDSLDREIGRANVELVRCADEAKHLRAPMDEQVSLSSISK